MAQTQSVRLIGVRPSHRPVAENLASPSICKLISLRISFLHHTPGAVLGGANSFVGLTNSCSENNIIVGIVRMLTARTEGLCFLSGNQYSFHGHHGKRPGCEPAATPDTTGICDTPGHIGRDLQSGRTVFPSYLASFDSDSLPKAFAKELSSLIKNCQPV